MGKGVRGHVAEGSAGERERERNTPPLETRGCESVSVALLHAIIAQFFLPLFLSLSFLPRLNLLINSVSYLVLLASAHLGFLCISSNLFTRVYSYKLFTSSFFPRSSSLMTCWDIMLILYVLHLHRCVRFSFSYSCVAFLSSLHRFCIPPTLFSISFFLLAALISLTLYLSPRCLVRGLRSAALPLPCVSEGLG